MRRSRRIVYEARRGSRGGMRGFLACNDRFPFSLVAVVAWLQLFFMQE
jgi:hypothetical protein